MIQITETVFIGDAELDWRTSKSSGAGGQHVNTTNSQVELRFHIDQSSLSDELKMRLKQNLASRLTAKSELIIYSQSHRSQWRNREECLKKLCEILKKALYVPKPRKKTRPSRTAVEKRLKQKRQLSEKKKNRKGDW